VAIDSLKHDIYHFVFGTRSQKLDDFVHYVYTSSVVGFINDNSNQVTNFVQNFIFKTFLLPTFLLLKQRIHHRKEPRDQRFVVVWRGIIYQFHAKLIRQVVVILNW
jgi:hypothetical protein